MKSIIKPWIVSITLITLLSIILLGCQQEKESMSTVTTVSQQPTATARLDTPRIC